MAESVKDSRVCAAVAKLDRRPLPSPVGDGPVRTLQRLHTFGEVHLLSDFSEELNRAFAEWLGCKPVVHRAAPLNDPTSYREVYAFASRILESIYDKHKTLCLHLSSGTSTMAAVWVLLGKTRFPALFYKTYKGRAIEETIPFDIMVDVVPELLRMQDAQLQRLATTNPQVVQGFQDIVGDSQAIKFALELARKTAIRDVNVLLTGESGTGKELFARAMHNASHRGRSGKPFYALNCAAVPEALFESELFGSVKGAYSGAINRSGAFELADSGTLFLDEVGELAPDNQAKLLRVMQPRPNDSASNRWVRRIGDKDERKLDVRIIAATNRDLQALVSTGGFRDDLYFRLAVVNLRLPSLRERRADIETLSNHLMERINTEFQQTDKTYKSKSLSRAAIQSLRKHDWPGNIRELNGLLTQLSVFSDSSDVTASEINATLKSTGVIKSSTVLTRGLHEQIDLPTRLKDVESYFIDEALREAEGNQTKAATLLGITQQCLSSKLKRRLNRIEADYRQ
jgi:transcriptional regulator with PAS, ATPase and Fis domain